MSTSSQWWTSPHRAFRQLGRRMRRLLAILANRDERRGALGRHSVMLGSLVVLLWALPLGQAVIGETTRFSMLLALVMISAIIVNSHQRWIFVVSIVIAVGSITGLGYAEFFDSGLARIIGEFLGLALLGFTALVMFNSLIRSERVSQDTIVGGICVFLLLGLCFAMTFILITDLDPGAFLEGDQPITRLEVDSSAHATVLLYFSFVTLTTLGYGDVLPHSEMARMFTVTEALMGQLYLVIFMARLVALYVVSVRRHSG